MADTSKFRDREFETGTNYVRMMGYVNSVFPDHVREHAREILGDTEPGYQRYRYAAKLTQHVFEEIDYSEETDLWRADFILDNTGKGDCEDQCTTLASLLTCRSFDARYVVVRKDGWDPGHIIVQVLFQDADLQSLVDEADDFYSRSLDKLVWEKGNDGYWLTCDPVTSPVVGTTESEYYTWDGEGRLVWYGDVLKDYLEF